MSGREPVRVCEDFTATTLRWLLGAPAGGVGNRQETPLPPLEDEAAWAWEVGGCISEAFAAEGQQRWALGIGVACPGVVDTTAGVLVESNADPADRKSTRLNSSH